MADESHKLQKDPPEGSRKVIEHELERQSGKADAGKPDCGAGAGQNQDAGKDPKRD